MCYGGIADVVCDVERAVGVEGAVVYDVYCVLGVVADVVCDVERVVGFVGAVV